jgi:hypothetical protein
MEKNMVRSFCLLLASMFVALFAGAGPAVARTRPDLVVSPGGSLGPGVTRAATFLTGDGDKNDDRDIGKSWGSGPGGRRDADHDGDRDADHDGDRDGDRGGDHDRDRRRRGNDHDHDGDDHAPKPIPEPSTLLSFAVAVLVGGGVLVSRRLLGSRK